MSHVMCHMSHVTCVTCHMSCVMCHVSHVTCNFFSFFFRVYYMCFTDIALCSRNKLLVSNMHWLLQIFTNSYSLVNVSLIFHVAVGNWLLLINSASAVAYPGCIRRQLTVVDGWFLWKTYIGGCSCLSVTIMPLLQFLALPAEVPAKCVK